MQRQYGLMAFLFLLLMLCLWAGGLENKPLQKNPPAAHRC